jgi:hypothetical protein
MQYALDLFKMPFLLHPYKIYLTTMSNGLESSIDALYGLLTCCLPDTVVLCFGQHSDLMAFHCL